MKELEQLIEEYRKSPEIYQASKYWKAYENRIIDEIKKANLNDLRSSKYPIFATFGFLEVVYYYHPNESFIKKFIMKNFRRLFITNKHKLPYNITLNDIREMAYNHCVIQGQLANIKPISEIEVSTFGNPEDLFEVKGKKYTMAFLNYYLRLCYFQKQAPLNGNEIIVELGSGSGHQVEVLKKVFPNLTILCFDLPYVLYLCHKYLENTFGVDSIVNPVDLLNVNDIQNLQSGKIYMFGNWKWPILKGFKFDVFWNAASFGEMEPDIVENYLSNILDSCKCIYLLQAKKGREINRVVNPINFNNYNSMLKGFKLINESEVFHANMKLKLYFQAVWKKQE